MLANFSESDVSVDLPDAERWAGAALVIGNYADAAAPAAAVTLRPWEAQVHRVVEG